MSACCCDRSCCVAFAQLWLLACSSSGTASLQGSLSFRDFGPVRTPSSLPKWRKVVDEVVLAGTSASASSAVGLSLRRVPLRPQAAAAYSSLIPLVAVRPVVASFVALSRSRRRDLPDHQTRPQYPDAIPQYRAPLFVRDRSRHSWPCPAPSPAAVRRLPQTRPHFSGDSPRWRTAQTRRKLESSFGAQHTLSTAQSPSEHSMAD